MKTSDDPRILKIRAQWRAANDRRKAGTQLPLSEYREKIARDAAERRARVKADLAAVSEVRKCEIAARREATRIERKTRQKANSKAWREANPERASQLVRAWKIRNAEKVRADKRARKVAKRVTVIRDLTALQRGRCAYCRIKLGIEVHVDHVMPLKRGGPDKRSNLQLTCAPCNMTKSAQHPVEFAQSLGRLL